MTFKPQITSSVEAGEFVFVSGQLPYDANRKVVAQGIRDQTALCLAKIRDILATRGLGMEHVVKTTVWLARREDFVEFNAAYSECFATNPPARSTVRADLMVADALVEIEAIARK